MIGLDVRHVFRVSGGTRGLMDMLDKHEPDHCLKYSTVQMWLQRNQIPAKWIGLIIYAMEREGHSCREFLIDLAELTSRLT
jgi:hypothetical protein